MQHRSRAGKWNDFKGGTPQTRQLAQHLRDLISRSGLTLNDLAGALSVSAQTISRRVDALALPDWEFVAALVRECTAGDALRQHTATDDARRLWEAASPAESWPIVNRGSADESLVSVTQNTVRQLELLDEKNAGHEQSIRALLRVQTELCDEITDSMSRYNRYRQDLVEQGVPSFTPDRRRRRLRDVAARRRVEILRNSLTMLQQRLATTNEIVWHTEENRVALTRELVAAQEWAGQLQEAFSLPSSVFRPITAEQTAGIAGEPDYRTYIDEFLAEVTGNKPQSAAEIETVLDADAHMSLDVSFNARVEAFAAWLDELLFAARTEIATLTGMIEAWVAAQLTPESELDTFADEFARMPPDERLLTRIWFPRTELGILKSVARLAAAAQQEGPVDERDSAQVMLEEMKNMAHELAMSLDDLQRTLAGWSSWLHLFVYVLNEARDSDQMLVIDQVEASTAARPHALQTYDTSAIGKLAQAWDRDLARLLLPVCGDEFLKRLSRAVERLHEAITDMTGADLTGADLDGLPLDGVLWSSTTQWPPTWDLEVAQQSVRLAPDTHIVVKPAYQRTDAVGLSHSHG
ncbi:transcriptional regulator with XRE-family HTH domain [Kibdelosporangium banguiense]|uniref:Transcriptional regulator with XRE-family HTH domain n=1 Tax=Kibdelosporangium banguiense TaxID=1365924 RepID=A0ABS4TTP0_9PSEU|nr:helix-turn-helix transcriptional regulator [Kibdelosporangium banguiense]MBP2327296.1 transcriptional regulator with XRE-family HTH domain [Kibdelosporangium banguiense]